MRCPYEIKQSGLALSRFSVGVARHRPLRFEYSSRGAPKPARIPDMTKTAAIYARQSVTTAGDKDVSIDDQIARCRALPAVAACDAVEVYIDRNRSGQDATREAFQKMLGRIESGELTVVAAY